MMSPMPVGVISSSARMTPMKPEAQPSRRPAKITGAAEGSTIFQTTCRREPRKARPISSSETGGWRTAFQEFSTITGIAMMHTVKTFDRKPVTQVEEERRVGDEWGEE